jgi:DNA-binding PadR family transcriptional regulator
MAFEGSGPARRSLLHLGMALVLGTGTWTGPSQAQERGLSHPAPAFRRLHFMLSRYIIIAEVGTMWHGADFESALYPRGFMKPWAMGYRCGHGGLGGGGMGHHGPRGYGPGRRLHRGAMRGAILLALEGGPMHGYQIMQELAQRTQGWWWPSPGSIYPTLQQLEDEGLVRAEEQDGRRVYALTPQGKAYLEAHREDLGRVGEALSRWAEDPGREVWMLTRQVTAAAMQVAQVGTPSQRGQAVRLLTETRQRLYRLLAEDPSPTEPV